MDGEKLQANSSRRRAAVLQILLYDLHLDLCGTNGHRMRHFNPPFNPRLRKNDAGNGEPSPYVPFHGTRHPKGRSANRLLSVANLRAHVSETEEPPPPPATCKRFPSDYSKRNMMTKARLDIYWWSNDCPANQNPTIAEFVDIRIKSTSKRS